jgi:hypothetical protein
MNLLSEIIPNITREQELLLCYARSGVSGPARARVDRIFAESVDWNRIDELAETHRVRPLLYKHLCAENRRANVPTQIWRQIESHAFAVVGRNLAQTKELVQLIKLFRSDHIGAMPFKGPVLASRIYGNLSLREFSHLDLLIRREDFLRAKLLLLHHGFTSPSAQTNHSAADPLDAQLGCDFLSADGNTRLELQWAFIHQWLSRRIDLDALWKRATWIDLANEPLRAIAREDLLPYLCAHGAKHHWERLIWIVDVAEFVRAENDLDWNALLETARQEGNWRVLALGLYLAYGLLDAALPRTIIAEISKPEIQQLAGAVGAWIFNETNRPTRGAMEETRFYLKTKERVSDRLAYTTHLAKLTLAPAVRPIRWLIQKGS